MEETPPNQTANLKQSHAHAQTFANKNSTLNTKLTIYKALLKQIWTYGLQLWGAAKKSNTNRIQTFQNISLRRLSNAPPYISNHALHNDFHMKTIDEEARTSYK
jgi:hypothetical protein